MGAIYQEASVFDCQVTACKELFVEKLPSGWPHIVDQYNGHPIYDISGFDAHQVVAVLSAIVNDRDQFKKNKTFYLTICSSLEYTSQTGFEELFRLTARPTPNQPGNGIVVLRPRGKKRFERGSGNSYEELNGALRAFYDRSYNDCCGRSIPVSDTISFAEHIKELFQNNARFEDMPQVTIEVYMILLFEIARRLVKSKNPSEWSVAFDDLPIGSAIARLLKLLELRSCSFEDVFFPGGRFHCFTGTAMKRREAIANINLAISSITQQETLPIKKYHLNEIQELFCSEIRLAEMSFKEEKERKAETFNCLTVDIQLFCIIAIVLLVLIIVMGVSHFIRSASFPKARSHLHWVPDFSSF